MLRKLLPHGVRQTVHILAIRSAGSVRLEYLICNVVHVVAMASVRGILFGCHINDYIASVLRSNVVIVVWIECDDVPFVAIFFAKI